MYHNNLLYFGRGASGGVAGEGNALVMASPYIVSTDVSLSAEGEQEVLPMMLVEIHQSDLLDANTVDIHVLHFLNRCISFTSFHQIQKTFLFKLTIGPDAPSGRL